MCLGALCLASFCFTHSYFVVFWPADMFSRSDETSHDFAISVVQESNNAGFGNCGMSNQPFFLSRRGICFRRRE